MKIIADANIPFVAECFSSIGEVEVFGAQEITPSVVAGADILLVRSVTRVDSDLLGDSKVRFVATASIGCEHIDIDFLQRCDIGFASAPASNANSVAEYVIAALLQIAEGHNIDLQGKSLGVIGVGNIGSKVVGKAEALGMKVYLNDPPLQRKTGEAKYLLIEKLFDCDFITLHTPLTFEGVDKTFHLADEKFFKSVKEGCVFFNTSRGGVVDTNALKTAIRAGKLEAVVLDVWEDEPNIDAELLEMVDIGTPHIAGHSLDGKIAAMIMVYNSACKYFGVEPTFDIDSFLPEPVVQELKINPQSGDSKQEMLRQAVERIYDIKKDDSSLRWMLDRPQGKRGVFFENLRENYPIRREFQNTRIVLESPCESLAAKLAGIGFKEVKSKE